MKRKFMTTMAMVIAAFMAFGSIVVWAIDYYVPEGAATVTARFRVMDVDLPGDDFYMLSEDYERLSSLATIHWFISRIF